MIPFIIVIILICCLIFYAVYQVLTIPEPVEKMKETCCNINATKVVDLTKSNIELEPEEE